MKQVHLTLTEQTPLTQDVFRLVLQGDISSLTRPGQFVNLAIPGFYLRRPISVCDYELTNPDGTGTLTLIYRTVGNGTRALSVMKPGQILDVLCGLGNGFDLSRAGAEPLLVGGGLGIPPLYKLARELKASGIVPQVVLGFNTKNEMFLYDEFRALDCPLFLMTTDGSAGDKGFVTDAMVKLSYTYFYSCGPAPMYRAMEKIATAPGEYSFEERMGCGFGACMGCTIQTANGPARVCREGPVFRREVIQW